MGWCRWGPGGPGASMWGWFLDPWWARLYPGVAMSLPGLRAAGLLVGGPASPEISQYLMPTGKWTEPGPGAKSYRGVCVCVRVCVHVCVLASQSCLTLCDPMDCSLPGFSVHGILLERILEWVAISFSRSSSPPKDQSWISCIEGRFFTI